MTREENLHWIDEEIRNWENECQSKHPIKEALYAARKALEQEPCEDAVSVTSVFEIMGNLLSIPYDFDRSITEKDVSESMDKIRELPRVTPQEPRKLEQEQDKPMVEIDLYSVIKQKYIEREVLDEIRAEIEEQVLESLSDGGDDWFTAEKVNECLEIIDKYKAESEGKQWKNI